MQPLGNKILVRDIIEEERKTAGGLFIPETAQETYKKVTIEAISPDTKLHYLLKDEDIKISIGDTCLSLRGGVELEKGLWLCSEDLLHCRI